MAGSARIDELKKKFDENPARYFAPLANEYRKAGEIEQAIEICRTYLAEKPGHMSGLIVFGQALYEAQRYDEARGTFEQALGLDPENLIALRHLGDISRDTGDIANARRWYQRVLDADPRNEEIATQLASLPTDAPAPPAGEKAAESTGGASFGWGDINPESEAEQPPAGVSPDATTAVMEPIRLEQSKPAEITFGTSSDRESGRDAGRTSDEASSLTIEPASLEEEIRPSGATPAAEGIERAVEFESPPPGRRSVGDFEVEEDFVVPAESDRPADGLEVMEFEAPTESAGRDSGLEVMEFEPPPTASVARDSELEVMEFEAPEELHAPAGPPRAPTPPSPGDAPEAFVTETMAELYLQQGYRDDALGVYRQLLERSPNDPHLRERIRQLESGGRTSVPMAAISDAVIEAAQESRATPSHPTVRSFFSTLAARRPRMSGSTTAATAAGASATAAAAPAGPPPSAATAAPEAAASIEPPALPELSSEPMATLPAAGFAPPSLPRASAPPTLLGTPAAPAPDVDDVFGSPGGDWPALDEPVAAETPSEPELTWTVPPVTSVTSVPPAAAAAAAPAAPPPAGEPEAAGFAASTPESVSSLFGGAAVTGADERAATTLAEAFAPTPEAKAAPPASPPAPAAPSAPAAPTGADRGRAARPADNELSLDSVFGSTPSHSGSGVRQTGGFSFDQFFSDSAVGRTRPTTPPSGTSSTSSTPPDSPSTGEEDEVAQFTQWLEGLKKK